MDGRAAYAERLHAPDTSNLNSRLHAGLNARLQAERAPPDGEGLQHQELVMPANDRARRPVRVRSAQLRSTPVRGTVPAWL